MWCKALILVVLSVYAHQGEAIKCHVCTSASDPKCGDPIDSSVGLTECTPGFFKDAGSLLQGAADAVSGLLGKMGVDSGISVPDSNAVFACVKAVRQDNDKKVVIRGCSIPKMDKFDMCSTIKGQGGTNVVTFCETCDTDGCNSANGVTVSVVLLFTALATLLARQ